MPVLEAPPEYQESSPEQSISPDFNAPAAIPTPTFHTHPANIQIRLHTAEPRGIVDAGGGLGFGIEIDSMRHIRGTRLNRLPRIDSFDRDLPTAEEDNHYPPFVHLLPVVLPPQVPEPTLDELLRRVTQRNDLQNVESVRLRVISYSLSLSRLSLFMPHLQQLDLNGSVLSSLRDLGCGLSHLTHLNVSNCGLNSFDGASGFPAVRVLFADGNMIQRVGPLTELPQLQRLSARNNRISELGLLTFLGLCANLIEIDFRGNAVCHVALYRNTLQRSIATLQVLDSLPLTTTTEATDAAATVEVDANTSDSEALSSLSSDLHSDSGESNANHRPATAPNTYTNTTNRNLLNLQLQRPATATTVECRESLSFGEPVAGSILNLARRNRSRRPRRLGQAWPSSSSSLSSNSSTRPPSSTSSSNNSSFDLYAPQ